MSEIEILVKSIDKLRDEFAEFRLSCDKALYQIPPLAEKVDELRASVNGNGKPGLKSEVQALKQESDARKSWFNIAVKPILLFLVGVMVYAAGAWRDEGATHNTHQHSIIQGED